MGEMTREFAIKVLRNAKVTPIQDVPGSPERRGYQNQKFYDIARNMAIEALREQEAQAQQETQPLTCEGCEYFNGEVDYVFAPCCDCKRFVRVNDYYRASRGG